MLKSDLLARLSATRLLVTGESLFIDDRVGETPHNIRARFLRSGLIVQMYASLEAYLKETFRLFCDDLANCNHNYTDFPDTLKALFTTRAVGGLSGLLRRTSTDDRLRVSEQEIGSLGLHVSMPPKFSALGFGYETPNINADGVESLMKAIGFKAVWRLVDDVCAGAGIGASNAKDAMKNFLACRNRAAHDPTAIFATSDVEQSSQSAFVIAISIDILLTYGISVAKASQRWTDVARALESPVFGFRFIDEGSDGRWRERMGPSGSTYRSHASEVDARREAGARAARNGQVLIIRDTRLRPYDWKA